MNESSQRLHWGDSDLNESIPHNDSSPAGDCSLDFNWTRARCRRKWEFKKQSGAAGANYGPGTMCGLLFNPAHGTRKKKNKAGR